jgi:hypothetical protein
LRCPAENLDSGSAVASGAPEAQADDESRVIDRPALHAAVRLSLVKPRTLDAAE